MDENVGINIMKKLPISAIVVGFNEGDLLSSCFQGISFCDQILYFDLGSTDNSIEIASVYNVEIVHHVKVPGCEWIHAEYANKTKNEWVLITDPDEVIDPLLAEEINELFQNGISSEIGSILAPITYYFKNHRLLGTPWGGNKSKVLVVNNKRFDFLPNVHLGRILKDGYKSISVKHCDSVEIHHYWMRDFSSLFEKHLRYLVNEGKSRYVSGFRTNIVLVVIEPFKQFMYSFFYKKGYKDGLLGFSLSVFWAWYQTRALFALLLVQSNKQK
jgi:hypothetical protein